MMGEHTPGPWEYVPSTEHHGPYVTSEFGSTICDCYTMTEPSAFSTANGGPSKPVPFMAEMSDPNARLIAAAPKMLETLKLVAAQITTIDNICNEEAVAAVLAAIHEATGGLAARRLESRGHAGGTA